MSDKYAVVTVPKDAAHALEAMGTKPKFWYHDGQMGLCLFKEARPNTGEDCAEKVAADLAGLLGLPHAEYELASWVEKPGVVSPLFLPHPDQFIPGNQLLMKFVPGYPRSDRGSRQFYRVSQHTIEAVLGVIDVRHQDLPVVQVPSGFTAIDGVSTAVEAFVGYLLLDAWIANTDRHHENWGWVAAQSSGAALRFRLAPTFDHASSLGSHETDRNRSERLTTRDRGRSMAKYVEKARSALYANEGDRKPLSTVAAFEEAARRHPEAGRAWLRRLASVSREQAASVLQRAPMERVSDVEIEFAQAILDLNRDRLIAMLERMS